MLSRAAAACLARWACGVAGRKKGGYYKDDGPQARPPANLDAHSPMRRRAPSRCTSSPTGPYEALGKNYVPLTRCEPFRQRGMASWYGKRFHGQKTSSGETYDMYAMTAAHPTLPIPSYARVTNSPTARAWWCASTTAVRSTPAASSTCPTPPPTSSATSRPGSAAGRSREPSCRTSRYDASFASGCSWSRSSVLSLFRRSARPPRRSRLSIDRQGLDGRRPLQRPGARRRRRPTSASSRPRSPS